MSYSLFIYHARQLRNGAKVLHSPFLPWTKLLSLSKWCKPGWITLKSTELFQNYTNIIWRKLSPHKQIVWWVFEQAEMYSKGSRTHIKEIEYGPADEMAMLRDRGCKMNLWTGFSSTVHLLYTQHDSCQKGSPSKIIPRKWGSWWQDARQALPHGSTAGKTDCQKVGMFLPRLPVTYISSATWGFYQP